MGTLKVALAAACAVVVGWAGVASEGITASAYVQDGLVAHYDGIKTWSGAANARWDDEGNWDPAGVPEENDVVRVPAGTSVLLDGPTASLVLADIAGTVVFSNWDNCLNAAKVRVASGGVVTSTGPFKDAANKSRVFINCTDLTVEKGGSIDVSAQGWSCGDSSNIYGYGPGTFAGGHVRPVAGGSHGGAAAFYSVNQRSASSNPTAEEVAALTYGSASAPETHGSGGYSTAGTGGAGGGVVRIVAAGAVTVCGSILANGKNSGDGAQYDSGGAGGSIFISCRTFLGTNGLVRARGGDSHERWSRKHYAGGGGRVAIIFDAAEQANLPVPSGMEYSADCGPLQPPGDTEFIQARPGTLYFSSDGLIDRTGCSLFGALDFANVTDTWTIESFRMTNGWATLARDSVEMRVTGDFEITGTSQVNRRMSATNVRDPRANGTRWEVGGTGTYCLTNLLCFMQASVSAPRLTVGGDFKVSNQGVVMVWPSQRAMNPDAAQPVLTNVGARVSIGGQLKLSSTGKLYLCGHPQNGAYPHVSAASLSVDVTSYVDANEQGYLGTSSQSDSRARPIPLTPTLPKRNTWDKLQYCSGGGAHGGRGGYHYANAPLMTEGYDSPTDPVLPGAGGVCGFNGHLGRRGGGVIFLDIAGAAVVDGVVRANGGTGSSYFSSGAAGGTVRLKCRTISGSGLVSANGAAANIEAQYVDRNGGGGGGGCVWVGYDPSAQAPVACGVQFQALGGIANPNFSVSGEPGSLYFSDGRLVEGVTTFRHAGRLYLPDPVTSLEFDTLTIDKGFLALPDGTLTVRGDLKIVGTDRRIFGLTVTNGSLACGGAVSVSNATITVNGGPAVCAERLTVGGEVSLDGGHLYVDFAPGDGSAKVDFKGGVAMDNAAILRITSPSNALAGVPGVEVTAPSAVLGDGCWIKPICCFTTGSSPVFRIGNIVCSPTGGFDATAGGIGVEYPGGPLYGYDNERYDGRGVMYDQSMVSVPAPGHGGQGGNAVEPGGSFNRTVYERGRGLCYGNERRPVLSGLAGSGNRQTAPSCRGGGVVRIEANKLLLNGGSLKADGENPGDSWNFRAGGSGGSVYVRAYKFVGGGGLVSARGGNGSPFGTAWHNDWTAPSAGGGRIAIWSSDGDTNVTTDVSAGDVPYAGEDETRLKRKGSAGTVRWCTLGGLMILVR